MAAHNQVSDIGKGLIDSGDGSFPKPYGTAMTMYFKFLAGRGGLVCDEVDSTKE